MIQNNKSQTENVRKENPKKAEIPVCPKCDTGGGIRKRTSASSFEPDYRCDTCQSLVDEPNYRKPTESVCGGLGKNNAPLSWALWNADTYAEAVELYHERTGHKISERPDKRAKQ